MDYVAAVEPFGLRSTLFFGKDWWPYHYAYNEKFVGQSEGDKQAWVTGQAASVVNPDAEPLFRRRPLLQVHYCHSGRNLIASEIEASQEGWCTAVQAVGSYAGGVSPGAVTQETSSVQFVDTDLLPDQQRMKLVRSGLYSSVVARNQAQAQQSLAQVAAGGVLGGPGGALVAAAASAVAASNLSTNVLNSYAVGVLHDEVREMYRGSVYSQGNAWIRPRHLIHFVDSFRRIAGPVEVKEVVHRFSARGGFVSTWSPDAVCYAQDTQRIGLISHAMATMGYNPRRQCASLDAF